MPALRVLVLNGNPVVSKLSQYRKTLILECKELTYLDSRPVSPRDRACAEAWKRGGYEEERKENERWNRKDRDKMRENVNATIRMRNKYLSADKQLKLFTYSDSENENADSQEERDNVRDGPILNVNDDIWDEVRYDKQIDHVPSSSPPPSSSEESSANLSSSLSVLDSSDPNTQESTDAKTNKLIQIVEDDSCTEEMIEDSHVEKIQEASGLPDLSEENFDDFFDQQNPAVIPAKSEDVDSIESDVDTTMFDMVDKMLEESGKSAAEYAVENIESGLDSIQTLSEIEEQIIQEQIANKQLEDSIGQLTNNVSLAMQELEEVQQQLTELVDVNAENTDSDVSEKSIDWQEWKSRAIQEHKLSSKECQFEEFKESDESSTQKQNNNSNNKNYDDDNDDICCENAVIKAFKKEEKELKVLLQRLEDENERMYGDLVMISNKNTFNDGNEKNRENGKNICENILKDILENLEIDRNAVKNCEIVDLDEYEKAEKPSQENNEQNFKTLNNVVSGFKAMMDDFINKNREEKQRQVEKVKLIHRKSVGTTAAQKTECLNNLLKSPNLAEFNADTNESLTRKVENVLVKQEKDLKKLVNRVYAQRDKYNDTLEVVDNRLVVVKQNTGEIEEISHSSYSHQADLDSDSESEDVSTGHDFIWEGVPLIEAHRLNTNKEENLLASLSSTFNYKPKIHLATNEVLKNLNEESSDSYSETYEKFYSLPELDFEELKLNEKDCEVQPIVQCARSYEELRSLLAIEKDIAELTVEESDLLNHIIEQEKSCNVNESLHPTEEKILLQKLVDRTKSMTNIGHEILTGNSDLFEGTTTTPCAIESLDLNTIKMEHAAVQEIVFKHEILPTDISQTEIYKTKELKPKEEDKICNEINENENCAVITQYFISELLENLTMNDEEEDANNHNENNKIENNRDEEILQFSHAEDKENMDIFNETKTEKSTFVISVKTENFKKTDQHEDGPIDINKDEYDEKFEKSDDILIETTNEATKDIISEDEHDFKVNKDTKNHIIDNDENFLSHYFKAEEIAIDELSEDKELGTIKEEEKEKEINIDTESCGDNAQIINKNITDDGNAYLVLQSAKLFEIIGDGNHTENNQLTNYEECKGSFISAIDDDCEEEKATDIAEAADFEIKSDSNEKQN